MITAWFLLLVILACVVNFLPWHLRKRGCQDGVRCSQCEYQLMLLSTTKCPECGADATQKGVKVIRGCEHVYWLACIFCWFLGIIACVLLFSNYAESRFPRRMMWTWPATLDTPSSQAYAKVNVSGQIIAWTLNKPRSWRPVQGPEQCTITIEDLDGDSYHRVVTSNDAAADEIRSWLTHSFDLNNEDARQEGTYIANYVHMFREAPLQLVPDPFRQE